VITEKDWARILSAFPAAHQVTVRAKIEAARQDYVRDQQQNPGEQRKRRKPGEQRELWQQIAKLLKSAAVTKLCQLASRIDLNRLPDPGFVDPVADRNWLPRMTEYLTRGKPIAAAYADLSKPRELLYARLIRAWTEAGLKLSKSATGPLARFVQDVTNDLFPRPITGEAIKKAVLRERARRRMNATVKIESKSFVIADATVMKGKTIRR
jgi:hypothetical protein